MSTTVMWILIVFYVVIMLLAGYERNWYRVLYFVGAITISLAVLGMTVRNGA